MKGRVTGSVRLRAASPWPEKVINLCAARDLEFWDLRRRDKNTLELTLSAADAKKLREAAEKEGFFTLETVSRYGVPFFFRGIRRRWALFLGLVLAMGAVWFSSFFIWQIEVVGNDKVTSAEILAALREEGIGIGSSVFDVDSRYLQDRLILKIPELSWLAVNVRGSRAYVLCREKAPIPDRLDGLDTAAVTARKGGLVTAVIVLRGEPRVQKGDTVEAGDLLCEAGADGGAKAVVTARTWYEFSASAPLTCGYKSYTGRQSSRTTLIFGEKRINFYFSGGNPYASCDKIAEYREPGLPGGGLLPLTVLTETFAETETAETELEEETVSLLTARLTERLIAAAGSGSIKSTEFSAVTENGVVTVTLRAECIENIAG